MSFDSKDPARALARRLNCPTCSHRPESFFTDGTVCPTCGRKESLFLKAFDSKEDERIIFNTSPASLTFRLPEYSCPVHGNVGINTLHFMFNDEPEHSTFFCLKCCRDKLIELGISQVKLL